MQEGVEKRRIRARESGEEEDKSKRREVELKAHGTNKPSKGRRSVG